MKMKRSVATYGEAGVEDVNRYLHTGWEHVKSENMYGYIVWHFEADTDEKTEKKEVTKSGN